MIILAIDPGTLGGLALFNWDKASNKLTLTQTLDTPYCKKSGAYGYSEIFDKLVEWEPDLVVIESTLSLASSGTTNAKAVGIGEGMWKCLFAILNIEYRYVAPQAWTKILGLKNDKKLTAKANKKAHVELASSLYPEFKSNFYGPRGGIKDGVADAVLIGEYWYRTQNNPTKKGKK